jgi:hypothetical protein
LHRLSPSFSTPFFNTGNLPIATAGRTKLVEIAKGQKKLPSAR